MPNLDYLLDHGIGPLFRVIGAEYATPPTYRRPCSSASS